MLSQSQIPPFLQPNVSGPSRPPPEVWPLTSQAHQVVSLPSLIEMSPSQNQVAQLSAPKLPYRQLFECPSCGKRFMSQSACSRHIRSHHLPYSAYCPFPGCSWRGDYQDRFRSHWIGNHPQYGDVPERQQIQIYDPDELVQSMMDGTLTVESAKGTARSMVEQRVTELGNIDAWGGNWWEANRIP
ncbi:hypothetical protein BJV74DRAFT_463111 [Russula compacta]|nr:hypothetical protein BJV74DRAFT_463111 [Russula compacta]